MGLYKAGFDVTGVDIEPQPHYPFRFIQADALTVDLDGYDAFWASPPCQAHTMAGQQWRASGMVYPDIIAPLRNRLLVKGLPFILENVPGAPLINPLKLNGAMFGLKVRRVRLFECHYFEVPFFLLPKEEASHFRRMGRPVKEGDIITPVGHFSNIPYARKVMGIDWMNQEELANAIPPAYSEYLGKYLMQAVVENEAE